MRRTRRSTHAPASPAATPTTPPTASCTGIVHASDQPGGRPSITTPIIVAVRMTAIGSFTHDSTSIVRPSRRRRFSPPPRRTAKTAAASVLLTTAPRSSAPPQPIPNSRATPAVTPAVTTTPSVASSSAGRQTARTPAAEVFRPPSNRISTRATVPTSAARA